MSQSLLPSLVDFWHNHVVPAFEERDRLPKAPPVGWIPPNPPVTAEKRPVSSS
jgi:hypothetical protein